MGERARLVIDETELVAAIEALCRGGSRILSVQPVRPSLEDYFMKEMGQGPVEAPWTVLD